MRSRIFSVGFDLPGDEFECINFDSDQTLLDADIILFEPTLGGYDGYSDEQYNGKSVLNHYASNSVRARLDHWRTEIAGAVNAGKLVVVYLARRIERYRYTGERRSSGTGRQTNIVTEVSSYEAVPNVKKVVPKSGSEMRLEKEGSCLASYWAEFSEYSPYEVEIEGEFSSVVLRSRVGDRIVGAATHSKGSLLFLPPLRYDDEVFLRDAEDGEDEDTYWTKEALQFGKRLLAALVAIADALKKSVQATAAPSWSLSSDYRLVREGELEGNISACLAEITKLQARRAELEQQLAQAGNLRRLLFEQGKPLERVILDAMKILGFDARPFSDGESEFDGVFVSPEGRCIGEAEGRDNRAINIDKFSQLERNLQEDFARDDVTEYAKGLLFGNAYRLKPVGEREAFFTEKCASAAKRVGAALIRTPDLFVPAKYLTENPSDREYAKKCREVIFATSGDIVAFPPPAAVEELVLAEGAGAELKLPDAVST
jgi:hypothetical protein